MLGKVITRNKIHLTRKIKMVILRAGNMRPQLLHKKDQKSALIKKRTALLMQIALVVSFMWLE